MLDTTTPRDRVVAAFDERDKQARLPRQKGRDTGTGRYWELMPEGLAPAEAELTEAIAAWQIEETFDREREPVMAQILDAARRKQVPAVRLLLAPRVRVRLQQNPAGMEPMEPQYIGYDNVSLRIPRAQSVMIPDLLAELLEQGGII